MRRLEAFPQHATSALARVEVVRAVHRRGGPASELRRATEVLQRASLIRIDDAILNAAADLAPTELRSLDAIHLSTAIALGNDLAAFVCYDSRLFEAARDLGLPAEGPR